MMIQSIWPSYGNLPNTIPEGAGITTKQFVSFFLFWLGSLPALWFPIYKIRHLFTVKAYFSPSCAIAFFAWAIARAHGLGPIVTQSSTAHGSAFGLSLCKEYHELHRKICCLDRQQPRFYQIFSQTSGRTMASAFNYSSGLRYYLVHRHYCLTLLECHFWASRVESIDPFGYVPLGCKFC